MKSLLIHSFKGHYLVIKNRQAFNKHCSIGEFENWKVLNNLYFRIPMRYCTIGIRCIYWDGKSTVQSLEGLWSEERGFFSKKVWGTHNYALIKSFAFLGHHL